MRMKHRLKWYSFAHVLLVVCCVNLLVTLLLGFLSSLEGII